LPKTYSVFLGKFAFRFIQCTFVILVLFMRLKAVLIFFLSLLSTYGAFAQAQGELTQSRILILLDESSSMIQKWPSGKEKYKAADELILHLMDSIYAINPDVEFSLRVFGHQYTVEQNNCYDTKNEVPFSKDNRVQMSLRLDDIHPLGVTPIAYALMQAAKYDLVDEEHNAYSIILFTDGGESCGGDICEVMKKLMKYKVYFKPYIVSLEDDPTLKTTYSCMGDFLQVTKDADMPKAVTTIVNAFRPAIKISKADYKQIQTLAANVPSALKVNIPISDIKIDTSIIKKESELPKPAPPKIDTPKPVAKIKVPEAPVKPAPEKIASLAPANHNLLHIKMPLAPDVQPVAVPAVEITLPPSPEQISMIIPARPLLSNIAIAPAAVMNTVPVPAVDIKVKPGPDQFTAMTLVHLRQVSVQQATPIQMEPVAPPATPAMEFPVTITPENINRATLSRLHPVAVAAPETSSPKMRPVMPLPPPPPAPVDIPVVVRKAEKISKLQTIKVEKRGTIIVFEERGIVERMLPPLPHMKIDVPKIPVAAATKTNDASVPFKTAAYKVKTEDAKETTVEIYLTDGHGRFYNSTPQMLLLEPGTNKIVKAFYRTVDASGNPDPLTTLPTGTFNLSLSDKRTLGLSNIKLEKNKKNQITVTVPPASLSFAYADAPERPITEFVARVTERNKAQGRVQDQKCTQELEYAAGNYHIMINTFPQIDRNTDIDFGETVITIPQPGFTKFIHDEKIQLVVLYDQEGDKFLPFHTIDLKDISTQPLRIQPGEYQAHYHSGPGGQYASEKVVTFFVKAKMETTVELR